MTDRVKGLVVTLDRDYRTDDVESIVNAIMMVKGVVNVDTNLVKMDDYMNRSRVVGVMRRKLFDCLKDEEIKLDT